MRDKDEVAEETINYEQYISIEDEKQSESQPESHYGKYVPVIQTASDEKESTESYYSQYQNPPLLKRQPSITATKVRLRSYVSRTTRLLWSNPLR